MKKLSQVVGLPLISVKEGVEDGIVQDIIIDPQKKRISSLILRGAKNEYDIGEIKLVDVTGIGKDYVITQSIENKRNIDLSGTGFQLLKMKCISASGDVLGSVEDFTFDEKTGKISSLQIDAGFEIDGDNILSISNNLLFVSDEGNSEQVKTETKEEKVTSSLEREQNEYLLGRTVKNDITKEDGTVIIKKGTVITADTIYLAEKTGVVIDLTLEVE